MVEQKSPAVIAFEPDRTRKARRRSSSAPEAGLEATLPASDPVSSTSTSILTGAVPASSPDQNMATKAPLVDIALASVRGHKDLGSSLSPDEELAALRAEVSRLSDMVAEIGSASVRVVRARSEDVLEDARAQIRARPIRTAAGAMLTGFLLGAVR